MSLKKYCQDTARAIAHGDDNQSAYVETLLTNTLKTLFEFRYPAAVWGNGDIISLDTDADPGSEAVQWLQIGDVGEFATVADNGNDLPQIDINGSVQSNRAETVAGFIAYTEQELQASSMQKLFSIATQKGQAAARSYQRTLGSKILLGSGSLPGIANLPGRFSLTATAAWSTLTPLQIQDEVIRMFDAIIDGTRGTFTPDTVVMPHTIRATFKKQNSVAANSSIEGFLRETYPEITKWVYNASMSTADAGGPMVVMLDRDPMVTAALVPEYVRPLVMRPVDLGYMIPFKSRFAGIRCTNPGSIATMTGV
jgi:hypothetical protein